jgi:hypothetical protein
MRQFKGVDWTVQDHFTLTPDALAKMINNIRGLYGMISKLQSQQQNQPSGQRPAGVQGPPPPPQQNAQSSMAPLNASNLQQLQQQEEAMRARRTQNQTQNQAAPAAPQLSQPRPFSIGASSPQGIPQAYGPGGFPPENLKLPFTKRRKKTHGPSATTSPVQAHAPVPSAKAETAKPPPADTNRVVTGSFKCSVPECEYHQKGFASQIALDKHHEESHKVDEPIEDPVQFILESFQAFPPPVKDEKAETKGIKKPAAVSADMQRVPSKSTAGSSLKQDIKVEGMTPPASRATPMGRGASQAGLKPVSPIMNQIPASRVSSSKGLGPSDCNQSKDDKKESGRQPDQTATPEAAVTKDLWADSAVSLDTIRDTFGDFGDDRLPGLGCDPIDEFLNLDMFTKIQNKDTPDSMDSGIVTQTPKDGDSSQDEEIDVKIGGIPDDNWIPVDWFNLPGRLEGELFVNEPWEMDWEKIEHKEADLTTDDGGMAIFT